MGCCFSKELSSDNDDEKTGLLQKSVEEKELENKISKTLSSLFDHRGGEELPSVESGAGRAAAGLGVWPGARAVHGLGHGPPHPLGSLSPPACRCLTKYEGLAESDKNSDAVTEQDSESACGSVCVGNGPWDRLEDAGPLSRVPVRSDQGLREEAHVSGHCPAPCKTSLTEKETVVSVQVSSHSGSHSPAVSDGEKRDENPVCADDQPHKESRERAFYSICVVDPDCLSLREEQDTARSQAAAGGGCRSAVPSQGTQKTDWPLGSEKECPVSRATPGAGESEPQQEELSCQGRLGPDERRGVFSEKTEPSSELLTDADAPCEADVGGMPAKASGAEACTGFPKDYTESSMLHNVTGPRPELNSSMFSDSLKCACAIPAERASHSSGIGSQVDESPPHFLSDTSCVGGRDEPGAVIAGGGQRPHSEKEGEGSSVKPLRDNDCFHFSVSRSESVLSVGLDRIHLSPTRFATSGNCGNERLSVHADFREAAPSGLQGPEPEHLPEPALKEELRTGDGGLEARSPPLAGRGELSLQPADSASHSWEGRTVLLEAQGHRGQAFELQSWCQAGLRGGRGAEEAPACAADLVGCVQGRGSPRRRRAPGAPPYGESQGQARPLPGDLVSPVFVFTHADEGEREAGLGDRTESEVCVQSSVSGPHDQLSDPHRLESAGKESLKADYRERSEDDIVNVKSDSKTTFEWETSLLRRRATPCEDVLTYVSSSVTENLDFEANQIETSRETHRVNDCESGGLGVVPPFSQSSTSVEQKSGVAETGSVDSGEGPELRQIYPESPEEVSGTFGNNVSGLSKLKLTCEKQERLYLEKDNTDPVITDGLGPPGTKQRACHSEGHATPTIEGSPLSSEMDFVENSEVILESVGPCDACGGCCCPAGAEPTRGDGCVACRAPRAIPGIAADGKEIVVPGSDPVFSLTEVILDTSESPSQVDWQSFPEEFSRFLNGFSYYPVGELASQVFSERPAGGCGGYAVGWLWTDTATKGLLEDGPRSAGATLGGPRGWDAAAAFPLAKSPAEPPGPGAGVIWGWPSADGRSVSVFISACCCAVIC